MKSIYNYLVDIQLSEPTITDNPEVLQRYLAKVAQALGFTILGEQSHKFNPMGVTAVLMLSESHISIHTWPEYSFAAIDILTCSGMIDKIKLSSLLSDELMGIHVLRISELRREMLTK